MKRTCTALLALPALALGAFVPTSVAHADDYVFSGRIVTVFQGTPIAGVEVQATPPAGSPATVAVTDADGRWSFTTAEEELFVFFGGAPDHQSGYAPCAGQIVVPVAECTIGPGVLPDLRMFATFISGRVADGTTGEGIAGVTIQAIDVDGVTPLASGTTDATGAYRVDGIATDEVGIRLDGWAVGYQSGFLGCLTVVATWGEACTWGPDPRSEIELTALPRVTFAGEVSDANGGGALAGIEVIATAPGGGGPAFTVTTAPDGTWSFSSWADEYELYFDGAPDYQSGYRACLGTVVQPVGPDCTYGPGTIGVTEMLATFVAGRVLDSVTAAGVAGAVVEVWQPDGVTLAASGVTVADGSYRVDGVTGDEFVVFVNGAPAGHQSGYFGCAGIVATLGESCTVMPGTQTDRSLAPLPAPPTLYLGFSLLRGTITMLVVPATFTSTTHELTCVGPSGAHVARTFGLLQTRSGFERGRNTCTLRALSPAGPGPATSAFTVSVR